MTYPTLMVYMELDRENHGRMNVAADLAERFDAYVIGVAACQPQPPVYVSGSFAASLVQAERERSKQKIRHLEQELRDKLKSRANTMEWRSTFAVPDAYVASQCRAADLVITGTKSHELLADRFWRIDPSDLVMRAGRPVLVVPDKAEQVQAKNIVIGWKNTREARRALLDALPLAILAEKVIVVSVLEDSGEEKGVKDVSRWLKRHGVVAEERCVELVSDAATQLDQIAREEAADLIVAGAYGHSRTREWILGGVTRKLIARSQGCSLLSH